MATRTTPIPQNKIEESYVWREWFQKISDRVFGTASTIDLPVLPIYGGTGITAYNAGDMLYSDATNHLNRIAGPSTKSLLTMSASGVPSWKDPRYGSFYDTTNQTAAANTPTAITYNSTSLTHGIAIGTPTSRITIDAAGVYNVQFSLQLANTAATLDDLAVWIRVNGTDVPNSTSWESVPAKHGGTNGHTITSVNFFYNFAANDYFELVWMTVNGTSSLETVAASGGPPAYPASPCVILTVCNNISV